ncbi:SET domain-containing protein [Saccharospirillum salsuginis]|uniref:SET domain-containing protein n=1 Tax=Saccharospirillum salsuginis TaxID=418750 RepID=A0A918KM02_9GAMM|nr:SET domain-containing protein-lysine N-methyltransferase [Saccharospirillum salsuginis]GGX68472.1 hypothetical protein GCM10007392_40050 [Saccharospirillum salsuginis]
MKKTVQVATSEIHGRGLFATRRIKAGTLIGHCQTRPTKTENDYTLWLETGPVDVTCELKYINHGTRPNVAYYDDLSVVALRDIAPEEELLHHYGDDWE